MFDLQKHFQPDFLRAVSNLKLFVELLWNFLNSNRFHSRISTVLQDFLLVFGNKRGFLIEKPFSCACQVRLRRLV